MRCGHFHVCIFVRHEATGMIGLASIPVWACPDPANFGTWLPPGFVQVESGPTVRQPGMVDFCIVSIGCL
jgi:hypothetical protein